MGKFTKEKTIGIVGGVGPYAGLDLNRKIFDHTIASIDQDHLPVLLASLSPTINDRTRFLLDKDVENPAGGLFHAIKLLDSAGADLVGIPCNTAHAQSIFASVKRMINESNLRLKILNMISEVTAAIKSKLKKETQIGVISTMGTYKTGLYKEYLAKAGIRMVSSDESLIREVHKAIYDTGYGIKAYSNPVKPQARQVLENAIKSLAKQGANAVILGCTELPMALPIDTLNGIPLIDPTTILARALIRETYPHKLKSLSGWEAAV